MNCCLLDLFESTVEINSTKIAVVHNESNIIYGKLKEFAQKIAISIIKYSQINTLNVPIAVFLPKEISTLIADIGIMYSANTFMNLDVKTPVERIMNIFSLIKPAAVITNDKYIEILDNLNIPIINIDKIEWDNIQIDEHFLKTRRDKLIDTDPFCIINTSGSTGTPKGVVLNHRSFFDFMAVSDERFHFDGTEIIGSLSPVVFDIFIFELCMMMINSSKIVILDSYLASFPARLIEKMVANDISFIFWVPSIMVNIANMGLLDKMELPRLRLVWFAGEVFPTKQFLMWYDRMPDAIFANLYGPIEITLDCTYYVVESRPPENEPLPIGIPYKNTDVLILDDNDELCQINEEGELCVRGTSLAMGYYNNFEKTTKAFTQNPLNNSYPELIYRTGDIVYIREDGNIMFKGRKDSLIKHMGYRIELGEIEHVLENDLKMVKYCCAVYRYSKKEIVLYYENDIEISNKEFRKAISKKLPSYMVPSAFILMEELPRNTNGKIDRLFLKNLD